MKIQESIGAPALSVLLENSSDEATCSAVTALQTIASALDKIVSAQEESPFKIKIALADQEKSRHQAFKTEGVQYAGIGIGGINGVNNTSSEASSHASILKEHSGGYQVNWVYNANSGAAACIGVIDYAPAKLLAQQWQDFFQVNGPDAIYYQECHSQGAAQVLKALETFDHDSRKRIYIVAIAPAMMIPDELCYQVKHYSSLKDKIPNIACERSARIIAHERVCKQIKEQGYGNYERMYKDEYDDEFDYQLSRLIRLNPHPNASFFDHELQSETYVAIRKSELENYIKDNK